MRIARRGLLAAGLGVVAAGASAAPELLARLRDGGVLLVLRHAQTVPGTGDPPGFRLDDCSTQRNLGETGRAQARAWGELLRREGVPVELVLSSAWCRCRETAELMAVGPVGHLPALDSFFEDRARGPAQTAALRAWIRDWRGRGIAVLVTHQVNITALTGIVPRSGEAVLLAPPDATLLGRLPPPPG